MKIKINNELQELNNIFLKHNAKLFIVGGFVRDSLLGLPATDIDLASKLTNEQLFIILENSGFKIDLGSKKLGTAIISKNNIKFEHTTFRKEEYKTGGFHTPEKVTFIKDIKEDAIRRDFTINSIYYDIEKNEIIDFFDGQEDLIKRQIKAIINPEHVFKSDGLRILRMVRFASELGFSINNDTYSKAQKMITQLNDITKDRLFKEFELILNATSKYGFSAANPLEKLIKLGAIEYIFKGIMSFEHNEQVASLYQNLYYTTRVNAPLKFTAFILDLALHFSKIENTKPSVIAAKVLNINNCGVSLKKRKETLDFIKAYEQSLKLNDDLTTKKFLQDHFQVLTHLFSLLKNEKDMKIYELLKFNYDYMKENKMPFNLKELSINGAVVKEELKQVDIKQIGKLLKMALKFCLNNKSNNTKTKILTYLKEEQKGEYKL